MHRGMVKMRVMMAIALVASGLSWANGAAAQTQLEGRVDRLEREMNAVQRKVFPGGSSQYFTPQITPQQQPQVAPGTPATNPVVALESRVSALEKQVASMTDQVEQAQYRVQKLETAFDAYQRATDARLKALEGGAPGVSGSGTSAGSGFGSNDDAPAGNLAAEKPTKSPAGTKPAAAPVGDVAGIDKPKTDDPADDAYVYGYRLWKAGDYDAAEKQLKSVVKNYPDHRRASWAQNLLGRAYLDDGKPSLASIAFYDNYKKMPNGERAPDSLFYLAKALIELKKPKDACQVYAELTDVYGDKISDSMRSGISEGRQTAKCQ